MNNRTSFHPLSRVLHWTMAALILAMLFIGVGMVSTVSERHTWLLAIHKPLGMAILLLAIVRLLARWRLGTPALPADMPWLMRGVAQASHWLLYALMFAMPLIGWAMLSAGGYPVTVLHGWTWPPIAPEHGALFGWLRQAHGVLAYLFFLAILGHAGAALYHGLIRRDDVLPSMTVGVRDAPLLETAASPASPIVEPAPLIDGDVTPPQDSVPPP